MQQHADFIDDVVNCYRDNYTCIEPAYTQLESSAEYTLAKYYPQWKEGNS